MENDLNTVEVQLNLIGHFSKYRCKYDNEKSLYDFLIKNYKNLFPTKEQDFPSIFAWNSFTRENLRKFKRTLNYSFKEDSKKNQIHLIDDFKSNNLNVYNSSMRHNDSILFFIQEMKIVEQIIEKLENCQNEKDFYRQAIGILETTLFDRKSKLLLDNFTSFIDGGAISDYLRHLFPALIWDYLDKKEFSFYKQFLVSYATNLLLIDDCMSIFYSNHGNIEESVKQGWLFNFRHKIYNDAITLLSIPEVILREKYPTCYKYFDMLQKHGIKKINISDKKFYETFIVNRTISDVYGSIFKNIPANNYYEYIKYCLETPVDNHNISKICHTFRVILNKIKHASNINLIHSRNADEIRKNELNDINTEIAEVEKLLEKIPEEQNNLKKRLMELECKKEINIKVKHTYETVDFQDNNFIFNNGIQIHSSPKDFFKITFHDLEISLKVLIGILVILLKSECGNNHHTAN